jgi:hypothetical protein
MKTCDLVLAHFDDEYCGCRSIVESPEWEIVRAIVVTDSTTQFEPRQHPTGYYMARWEETKRYIDQYNSKTQILCLNYPEQLWSRYPDVYYGARKKLIKLFNMYTPPYLFVPHMDDNHDDHKYIGQMFEFQEDEGPIATGAKLIKYFVHRDSDHFSFNPVYRGRAFNTQEFKKLYPSQRHQVPPCSQELYLTTEDIDLENTFSSARAPKRKI